MKSLSITALRGFSFALAMAASAPAQDRPATELAPLQVTADLWSTELAQVSASATVFLMAASCS